MKKSEIAVIIVVVALVALCVVLLAPNGETVPHPTPLPTVPTSSVSETSTASVSTSTSTFSQQPLDAGVAWAIVQKLSDIEGKWGAAELRSKTSAVDAGADWSIPYAWQLTVDGYDCGVHELLIEDYRLAYCQGGKFDAGRRHAVKLSLRYTLDVDMLHVQIGEQLDTVLRR